MQLILSIDDIGIKKNMSSEETNQSENKNKTEFIDNNLTSSLSPRNIKEVNSEKHDQNLESSRHIITDVTNGTALCDDASLDDEHPSKIGENCVTNHNSSCLKDEDHDINDINKLKKKAEPEVKNNVLSEEQLDECLKEKSSVHETTEENCDKNINSETCLPEESDKDNEVECQDVDINESESESKLPDDNVVQEPSKCEKINEETEVNNLTDAAKIEELVADISTDDAEMKQVSCEYEKVREELAANNSSNNAIESSGGELPQHNHTKEDQNCKENGNDSNVISSNGDEMVKANQIIDMDTDVIDNVISDNVVNCKIEDSKINQHSNADTDQDNTTTCSVSDEVIDIADERDSTDIIENEYKDNKIQDIPTDLNEDIEHHNEHNLQHKERGPITIDEDIIDIADEKDSHDSIENDSQQDNNILKKRLESDGIQKPLSTNNGDTLPKNGSGTKESECKKSEPTDKVTKYKLSNTLDILSDEEEESSITKPVSPKPNKESETNKESEINHKQCINIEEDDDIMVIDDELSTKDENCTTKEKETVQEIAIPNKDDEKKEKDTLFETQTNIDKDPEEPKILNETKIERITSETIKSTFPRSPLLSSSALKSFKKNLGEMTREELEDFCILTIAEAVFDRSNLGELKSQMKILTQNIEEHKLKAKNLTKQNRDLQVVLKSIQEEQKKNSDAPITPLKITRSVGMQVLMTEKASRKRQAMLNSQLLQNSTPIKQTAQTAAKVQNKPAASPNVSNAKTPPRQTQQQIPVPRLVPAVNSATKPTSNSSPQASNLKSPASVPNGIKTTPIAPKPEKRTHTKMQQTSAVTVDLTDDEPPAKVVTRNFNSPVRCVPPQTLLAPRPTLPMTSPRKVYIPISGQQAQNIRPGQHIMLKSVTGTGGSPGRPRGPSPNVKAGPNVSGQIRPRIAQRHPAPLPELMKQYQPPNWKALPPAPELKLAKVENGIVISWKIDGYREENHEEIASYQLFAYQETSQTPNTSLWKKIGDVKALPLPMACTLTQFMSGYKYYFAVRAVDVKSRFGPFSLPGSILLLKN